jgi:AraC-like DNA-binding protein
MRPHTSGGAQPHVAAPSLFTSKKNDFIAFAPGLLLSVCEFSLHEPAHLQFNLEDNHCVVLGFLLSGATSISIGEKTKAVSHISAPMCLLSSVQGRGVQHYPAGKTLRVVEVCAEPEALHTLLGDAVSLLPRPLRSKRPPRKVQTDFRGKLTPFMESVCHQILRYPLEADQLRHLYMQSKALELILLLLQSIGGSKCSAATGDSTYIAPSDRCKLDSAREILLSEYADPPAITALAHRVGMNECKLKLLFKRHFGVTMYALVRQERMLIAKRLLREGLTVSQTAGKVGYVNLSHFSDCFRMYFGVTPSQYKRSI